MVAAVHLQQLIYAAKPDNGYWPFGEYHEVRNKRLIIGGENSCLHYFPHGHTYTSPPEAYGTIFKML